MNDPRTPLRSLSAHHVEVHADAPEEGESGRERVNVEPGLQTSATVLEAVRQRERHLIDRTGARLLVVGSRNTVT